MEPNTSDKIVRSKGLETVTDVEDARRMADDLVRSAITSLRKPITIPSSSGVDASDARNAFKKSSNQRDITNEIIDTESERYGSAAETYKEAITRGGKASADKVMADQARAQQEAELQSYFARLFGVTDSPDAEIAVVAQRIRQLRPIAEAKLRNVQEMQSVGLLDNPLEWFANKLQLSAAISDYNAEAILINSLQGTLNSSIKTGQNAANFASRGIPTITTSQAKADADKLVALAVQNRVIADENLAKQNVSFAIQKLSNDITIANQTKEMTQLDLQNEQIRYTSLINEINLADKHSERLLRAAQLIEKLEGTKGLDIILAQFDRTMGHPSGTTTRYTFEKFAESQRQNIIAIGSGSIGADPFEGMINWYRSRPGPGASKETVRFFDFLRDESEKISVTADVKLLDEKQKPAIISKKLKEQIQLQINDASRLGNIFYEMTPAQMIASGAVPADSHLAKVLEPFTKQTGPIPTNMILEAINKEYPNPAEAGAVISDYYKRNIQLRNSVMNTSLAGITLATNYNIRKGIVVGMEESGGLGGGIRMQFDLTRPEEATKFILLQRAGDNVIKAMGEHGLFAEPLPPKPKVDKVPSTRQEQWREISKKHKEYFNPGANKQDKEKANQ